MKRQLTEFEKSQIWKLLYENKQPDDREPIDVMVEDFGSDEEQYLLTMAKYHGVSWIYE